MNQRPITSGQLLRRLISPRAAASRQWGPLIASATEVEATSAANESPQQVILHSIPDSRAPLIHPRPISAGQLAVQIKAEGGNTPRLAGDGRFAKMGELYESTAQFSR